MIRGADAETAYEKSLHPSWTEGWKGGANLGFAIARGNTETTNLSTGFNADRKTLHDQTTMYFGSLYSTDDKTGGGTIANSIIGESSTTGTSRSGSSRSAQRTSRTTLCRI